MKEQQKISSRSHSKKTFLVVLMLLSSIFLLNFVSAEYYIDIYANEVNGSVGSVNVYNITTGAQQIFRVNATNGDDEVDRALVMEWLFYGTDGSNPRASGTYMSNVTKMISGDKRDFGKQGHYAQAVRGSNNGAPTTYTGTFVNTTGNNNVSSWSYVSSSSGGSQWARWEIPSGSTKHSTTGGTSDEIGTDTSADEVNNPSNAQLDSDTNLLGQSQTVRAIILTVGDITWSSSGGASFTVSNTDFLTDNSIPAFEYFPEVTLNAPSNASTFLINTDITFNATATIDGSETLSQMKLWIDGVLNETKTISGTSNTTTFTKSFSTADTRDWLIEVCDTQSFCTNSTTRSFTTQNFIVNSATFNATAYETGTESYVVNVSGSPSTVTLVFDGTEYSTAQNGQLFTASRTIPTAEAGNKSFYWNFDDVQNSSTYYQDEQLISFAYCNSGTSYLNFSFANEENSTAIKASIPTSTFEYYLGDGTETKTLTYINSTEALTHNFCFNVTTETVYVDYRIQYEADGYPQRIYDPEVQTLTNSTTNTTLYLLPTTGNQYVTIQFINTAEQALTGVAVTATRSIGGEDVTVSQGTSDASGSVTFFLDPDFVHTFTYELSGYTTLIQSFAPTQTEYTVTLESTSTSASNDYLDGMSFSITPANATLLNDTNYTFSFTLSSDLWQLDSFGFVLKDENGATLYSVSSTSTGGGSLTKSFNTGTNGQITLDYFWEVNDTYINGTRIWYVVSSDGTDWSLLVAINNTRNVLNSGIFGANAFAVGIITFLFIFVFVGIMSWKFGITSPVLISVIATILVAVCDIGFGLFGDFKLAGAIPHLPTIILFMITIGLWAEGRR